MPVDSDVTVFRFPPPFLSGIVGINIPYSNMEFQFLQLVIEPVVLVCSNRGEDGEETKGGPWSLIGELFPQPFWQHPSLRSVRVHTWRRYRCDIKTLYNRL